MALPFSRDVVTFVALGVVSALSGASMSLGVNCRSSLKIPLHCSPDVFPSARANLERTQRVRDFRARIGPGPCVNGCPGGLLRHGIRLVVVCGCV